MSDLDGVRQGDREARERWVAAWWPRVYRMALALTGRDADAEDLAQETLLAALDAAARFRGEAAESTWIYAILLKKHRGRFRRRPVAPPPRVEPDPAVEDALALLDGLPAAQRLTTALYYVEDFTLEEIARALGVPRATVRWRLFWARRFLRAKLAGRAPAAIWRTVL